MKITGNRKERQQQENFSVELKYRAPVLSSRFFRDDKGITCAVITIAMAQSSLNLRHER